jgi:hypothetical protein
MADFYFFTNKMFYQSAQRADYIEGSPAVGFVYKKYFSFGDV